MGSFRQRPLHERLEARTDKSGGPDACWVWTGGFGQYDQPTLWHENRTRSARRLVWELATKSSPQPHRLVTVTCGDSRCVNPKHLALRTVIDIVAKFWEKVDRRGPNDCWPWTGNRNRSGYGRHYRNKTEFFQSHRFSYELHHQVKLDPSVFVCHRCDNPPCCNPAHLWLGTPADNVADCIAKGRNSRGPEHAEKCRRTREARANMQRLAEKAMGISSDRVGTDREGQ